MKFVLNFFATLSLLLFLTASSWAMDLDQARRDKAVTEDSDRPGYLKAVKSDGDTKKFVEEINQKRREAYEKIAKDTKVELKVVEQEGARKIQEKLSGR